MNTIKAIYSLTIVAFIFIGCATTTTKFNSIRVGMTKQEVIDIMGEPYLTSAINKTEYLIYSLLESSAANEFLFGKSDYDYYVRIVNGKVDSFGEKGDFDSTKDPTVKIITEGNIKTSKDNDMYQELMKLKQLKDEGILSDEEFEEQKKKVLNTY